MKMKERKRKEEKREENGIKGKHPAVLDPEVRSAGLSLNRLNEAWWDEMDEMRWDWRVCDAEYVWI